MGHEVLFKYWAKELLLAFRDIVYRCTYCLEKEISLKNVYISDVGIKLTLKKVKFSEPRDDSHAFHLQIESQFLRMYAKLLIEMLTNREDYLDFDHLDLDPELKCILYESYHAKDKTDKRERDRYESEINRFIQKEVEKTYKDEATKKARDDFYASVEAEKEAEGKEKLKEKAQNDLTHHMIRSVKRKQDIPVANRKKLR